MKRVLAILAPLWLLGACGGGDAAPGGGAGGGGLDLTGVYVPAACQGREIRSYPTAADVAARRPEMLQETEIAGDLQLEVLDGVDREVREKYVDPALGGIDWSGPVAALRSDVASGLDAPAFYQRMRALITSLGDDHSHFQSPAEVEIDTREAAGVADFQGIGTLLEAVGTSGRTTILSVFPGSPAERAGLAPHDSIVDVNGFSAFLDGRVWSWTLGPACTAAVLNVAGPGRAPRKVSLVRDRVVGSLPLGERQLESATGAAVGYVFIPTFLDTTLPGRLRTALASLDTTGGLIIDNRMNGGGLESVSNAFLALFTQGHLGDFVSRTATRPMEVTADPVGSSQTVPLAVLVGEGTASFGEVSSGVLQDSGRAPLVGTTTEGNVETLHSLDGADGSRLWLAEERFDPARSHATWETTGLIPDVEAYAPWDTFTQEGDPSVAAALDLLGK